MFFYFSIANESYAKYVVNHFLLYVNFKFSDFTNIPKTLVVKLFRPVCSCFNFISQFLQNLRQGCQCCFAVATRNWFFFLVKLKILVRKQSLSEDGESKISLPDDSWHCHLSAGKINKS